MDRLLTRLTNDYSSPGSRAAASDEVSRRLARTRDLVVGVQTLSRQVFSNHSPKPGRVSLERNSI